MIKKNYENKVAVQAEKEKQSIMNSFKYRLKRMEVKTSQSNDFESNSKNGKIPKKKNKSKNLILSQNGY